MDSGLAQRAVDQAFADHVSRLFGIMCADAAGDSPTHAVGKFKASLKIAREMHAEAAHHIDELGSKL